MRRLALTVVPMVAAILCGVGAADAADQPTLNIYNWSDYIASNTIPDFERATGIKVNYDTYDANEILDAKLAAGSSGYDLVVPSLTPFQFRHAGGSSHPRLMPTKRPPVRGPSCQRH